MSLSPSLVWTICDIVCNALQVILTMTQLYDNGLTWYSSSAWSCSCKNYFRHESLVHTDTLYRPHVLVARCYADSWK